MNRTTLACRIAVLSVAVVLTCGWLRTTAAAEEKTPPAKPESMAAPATEETKTPTAESELPKTAKLRFQFRYQPWKDVLEWFARKANLTLQMESTPPGTFNYRDAASGFGAFRPGLPRRPRRRHRLVQLVDGGRSECRRQLWMDERGTSGDLSEVWVRCECKAQRTVGDAVLLADKALGACDGSAALARATFQGAVRRAEPPVDPHGQ